MQKSLISMYLNEDASGGLFVSAKPMNQTFYSTPARLKCVETKAKKITRKGGKVRRLPCHTGSLFIIKK